MRVAYLLKENIYVSQICLTKFRFDRGPRRRLELTGTTRTLIECFLSLSSNPYAPGKYGERSVKFNSLRVKYLEWYRTVITV
jgi:hypothetical protein